MRLLLASNLNGNRRAYDFLIGQAENFDAMFWAGGLIDAFSKDAAGQRALVESAAGEIEAKGCRVLASSGERDDWAGPWLWLGRQGIFLAPGLLATTMPPEGMDRERLNTLRETAWRMGALWVMLSREPVAPGALAAGAPENMLLWPRAALRFGPDVIAAAGDSGEQDWCSRQAHTWVLTPGGSSEETGDFPTHVVLDTQDWTATRRSPGRPPEQRDISALAGVGTPRKAA